MKLNIFPTIERNIYNTKPNPKESGIIADIASKLCNGTCKNSELTFQTVRAYNNRINLPVHLKK